ncbi:MULTISPECIES: hypothetical protein [unclassified Microcoleus]|uniref:hypothetical protein n=1 Tax=unclassified Microcoleus TaxID=2642155 RepID=UPI002FD5F8AF
MTEGTLIEILEVTQSSAENSEFLRGCNIDMPNQGDKMDSQKILFKGWVLGKKYRALAVELISSGETIEKIAVDQSRPDVFEVSPDISYAKNSGFLVEVEVSKLLQAGALVLEVVFSDGRRVQIGEVQYRKKLPFLRQVQEDLERSKVWLQNIEAELSSAGSSKSGIKNTVNE